uniref:hypothetical protein n=1 Tax=Pseudomonas aeruginosa TaxID=287 RepID=UPI00191D4774|nr:hypothetical protein [Pseudomonas aeruginosa]
MANSPGTGSSSTRWPSSDLDARRKSTRWPTHQAPAAAQPGGQLTRHRQQFDQVAKFRSGRQKEINQVANSPGTGSSSTRWPTHQAPAAVRPGSQVQIWTPEGNQPGGQLTRHRQQLDQVAHFVRTKSGDAMRNLGSNPP